MFSSRAPAPEASLSIVLIGDSGVGKSSLLDRMMGKSFQAGKPMTNGVDIQFWTSKSACGKKTKNRIYDLSGHERFKFIRSAFYKKADIFLAVFDLTNQQSFQNIVKWAEEFRAINQKASIRLVGTKSDVTDKRQVKQDDINALIKTLGDGEYVETSAKFNEGTRESLLHGEKQVTPRAALIARLSLYVGQFKQDEDYTKFSFFLFKRSRAMNRVANVMLAKELIRHLENPGISIGKAFSNIDEARKLIIKNEGLDKRDGYVNRGMNSHVLKKIIKDALPFVMAEKKTALDQETIENDLYRL